MLMIKKSSLNSHADCIIPNKVCYEHEHLHEETLKVIDGRDMLDVTEDKLIY